MRPSLPLAALALALASPALAQTLPSTTPKDVGLSEDALARIEPAVEGLIKNKTIPGAVVLIARGGKIAYCKAFGNMNAAGDEAMKRDSIVRIFSMSKPITTVAALMLVDEGKLALDAPVGRYIPELANLTVLENGKEVPAKRQPTIRDLMRHTAGFTYGFYSNTPVDAAYIKQKVLDYDTDLAAMCAKLGKIPLIAHPGDRWHYSVSIDVLGRVVEVASGERLDAFFKERIFEPLGMKDTGFIVRESERARFADNFSAQNGGPIAPMPDAALGRSYFKKPKLLSGGGGLVSTADDYLAFAEMLRRKGVHKGKRLLSARAVAAMSRNQLPKKLIPITLNGQAIPGTGFGLGVSVVVEGGMLTPASAIGEYGWSGAATTTYWVCPKQELTVVVLTQVLPFAVPVLIAVKPLIYAAVKTMPRRKRRWY